MHKRCQSTYPGAATLQGRAIRCELPSGHVERHGHSFAARYWDDWDSPAVLTLPIDPMLAYYRATADDSRNAPDWID